MKLSKIAVRLMAAAGLLLFSSMSSAAVVKGADVSWTSEIEANGYSYYNRSGVKEDIFAIMKEEGMTAARLRVWVNPSQGWYNTYQDVVAKAKRAKAAGLSVMIDFHYSDSWADPGQQTKPSAWASHSLAALKTDVYNHTYNSLVALKDAGVTPLWVQVGNETSNGMLWDDGKASTNMAQYAALELQGYNAVKSVFPSAKVVVHLANCFKNADNRWLFDGLVANGGKFDVLGFSDYPTNVSGSTWQTINASCLTNLNDMVSRYGKEVMISEIGVPWDNSSAQTIVKDMVTKVGQVTNSKGIAIFYWEPEARPNWAGYTMGAMDANGKATAAWDAFK